MNTAVQNIITGRTAAAIAREVESAIREQRLSAGERLPTVRALAHQLGASPATVASAYRTLRSRGLVYARGRQGTRVSERPPLPVRAPVAVPAGARNLADGNPDPALLPHFAPVLRRLDPAPRLYAEDNALPELLRWARRDFGRGGIPNRALAVVGGALDGIERVLQVRLRPGDAVALEDPGYSGVIDLVHALGLHAVSVAIDEHGMRPEALERAVSDGAQAAIVMPRAQNPTGAALDASRVRDLRRVLRGAPDLLLIEDDHAGSIAGAAARTLCGERRAPFAVVRSLSKPLGPDLRVALLAGDPETVARVEGRQLLGSRWVSHVLQQLACGLLAEPGLRQRLRRARGLYASRRNALLRALHSRGIGASGSSGLNVWVPVPEEAAVVSALRDAGWVVAPGERFRIRSGPGIRITTSTLPPEEAARLAADLHRILQPSGRTHSA